jgi:murein L,D-transpeptidase YcbB/YkuD
VLEAAQQLRNPPITLFINEIKQRQALIGLKADGIVGPKTLAHALDMIRMAA